jgi:5-methylcytosine-specific restriction endonuclease McrA
MPNFRRLRPPFNIELRGKKIHATFSSKALANDFARFEFYSRVLHTLKPDANHVWQANDRLDVEIKGWAKGISWKRESETKLVGVPDSDMENDMSNQVAVLRQAIPGALYGERGVNAKLTYNFEIGKGSQWLKYSFNSKARTIAALCVLYDLEPHPRNDLELNVPKQLGIQFFPPPSGSVVDRIYGDPSKTADVLRNEGWQRVGNQIGMRVFQQRVAGARQQMYRLLRKEQLLESQVLRTNIQKSWRDELFRSQNYTCQICHIRYAPEYLEPDHRIPVIVQADQLTKENLKEKLMTLCRYCNQVKREACKVLPKDYDWTHSCWAYPEKFELEKIKGEITAYAAARQLSFDDVLKLLKK